MSLGPDIITQQLALLAAHRRTLAHLLEQAAAYGGEVFAPPQTANGIAEARATISRIKTYLGEEGIAIEDAPIDDVSLQSINIKYGSSSPTIGPALHQLRAPVSDFVGREREVDHLVQGLRQAADNNAAAAISGIYGMGGMGKTELALVVAHRLKNIFPDAQLLLELHGASSEPLPTIEALQMVIRSFEREAKLPVDMSQLRGLYNSVLNGKRVLILADDAEGTNQIRSLMPPPGCALLITSRNRFKLPGMAALDLGMLPKDEAEKLLLTICPRIGVASAELARLCGYLPLALRVSASFLANSSRDVTRYLGQLEAKRLEYLSDPDIPDDPTASVEASLRVSYDALESAAQHILCQLSVFPASFDQAAALAIVLAAGDAEALLDVLKRRSLLEWDVQSQRFSLHELVRAFALERLKDADAVRLRHAQYYAKVVAQAEHGLYLNGNDLAGLALFDQERVHIDAGWSWARVHSSHPEADLLLLDYANATVYIGDLRYDLRSERIPQLEAMLLAAQRLNQRSAEGTALGILGEIYADLGDTRKAITLHKQHLDIARTISHRRGEGQALGNLGNAYADLGDVRTAITFHEQNLAVTRELGDRRAEGEALGNLGNDYAALGDARTAIEFYQQRLIIARDIGDRRGEAASLGNLGVKYVYLGDPHKAIEFLEQHLAISREIGHRRGEGTALGNLAVAYAMLGDSHRAQSFYEQRMAIAHETGDRAGAAADSWSLGIVLVQRGDLQGATQLMQICVDYEREINHLDAEKHAAYLGYLQQRYATEQARDR